MKFKLLLMAAACIGMVACSKDDAANPSADGSKQIVLKVNLPTTRAVSDSWLGEDGAVQATAISSMNVFFTNANGTVQDQYTLSDDDITSVRTTGIRFVGLDDVTAVYIVPLFRLESTLQQLRIYRIFRYSCNSRLHQWRRAELYSQDAMSILPRLSLIQIIQFRLLVIRTIRTQRFLLQVIKYIMQ